MSKIIDGKFIASKYHALIKAKVENYFKKTNRRPGLGVILVGDNPASKTYIANKEKIAKEACGFETFDCFLNKDASFKEVESAIQKFNNDKRVDGILLQLPLPKHLESNALLDQILPNKDADGLHPFNQGLMLRGDGELLPCTPLGCVKLIDWALSGLSMSDNLLNELKPADLSGKIAVVVGRSILVGRPLARLLESKNATVIQAHSKTKDLKVICNQADILVSAVGVPKLISVDHVKPGAIVIDVGTTKTSAGNLAGDVDFENVKQRASAITPVPGGVGPMTIAMLMWNTLKCYEQNIKS